MPHLPPHRHCHARLRRRPPGRRGDRADARRPIEHARLGGSAPGEAPARQRPRAAPRRLAARDVRELQALLRAAGFTVAIDGKYAYKTSRAVQRFQVAARLQRQRHRRPARRSRRCAAPRAARAPARPAAASASATRHRPRASSLGDRIPLAAGMSGHDVRELQDYLRRAGVKGAPRPTASSTARTADGGRRFERAEERTVDGEVDAGDIYALLTEVGAEAMPGDAGDPSDGLPAPPLAPGDKARLGADGLAVAPEGAPEAVKQIIAAGNQIAKQALQVGRRSRALGGLRLRLLGLGLLRAARRRPARRARCASYDYFELGPGRPGPVGHDLHELRPHVHDRSPACASTPAAAARTARAGRRRCATPARSRSATRRGSRPRPPGDRTGTRLRIRPSSSCDGRRRSALRWLRARLARRRSSRAPIAAAGSRRRGRRTASARDEPVAQALQRELAVARLAAGVLGDGAHDRPAARRDALLLRLAQR